jgi:class 3 adenylate cyclase
VTNYLTGIVTFLFTYIEGSTKLPGENPETWQVAPARHHAILREAIESNNGFAFQIIGDAFCADVSLSPVHS